jgi:ribose transport system permease protein
MNRTLKIVWTKFLAIFLLPAVVYLIFLLLAPSAFLIPSLPLTLLNQSINMIVLAWGMSFGMMIGNMDMSSCAEQILGTIVAVLLSRYLGIWGLVLGVVLIAVAIGFIKAVLMAAINMKSMVISIAYTLVLGSIGYLITGGESVTITSDLTILGDYPYSIIIFAASGILIYCLHRYSVFGAQCKALSGNEALALSAGINKKKVEGIAIIICSCYIAISALLAVSRGAGATPSSGLNSLSNVFSAMSGVFVAIALSRYITMPIGIMVGVYSMNIITVGLIACNMNSQLKTTVNGGFLLVLMLLIDFKNKRDSEKMRRRAVESRMADVV